MFTEDPHNDCLPFDEIAADNYAEIVAERRRQGRPISVEDARIAAIACTRSIAIATRNRSRSSSIIRCT